MSGRNLTAKEVDEFFFYRCASSGVFGKPTKGTSLRVSKLKSIFQGNIHKSTSDKIYIDFDVDTKEQDKLRSIIDLLKPVKDAIVAIIETRGGYHIVSNKSKLTNMKAFHDLHVSSKFKDKNRLGKDVTQAWFTIISDPHIPIPGTFQGGFKTNFVDVDEFLAL